MAPWHLHLLMVHFDPFILRLGGEAQQQRAREEPGLGGHETNGRSVHRDTSGMRHGDRLGISCGNKPQQDVVNRCENVN